MQIGQGLLVAAVAHVPGLFQGFGVADFASPKQVFGEFAFTSTQVGSVLHVTLQKLFFGRNGVAHGEHEYGFHHEGSGESEGGQAFVLQQGTGGPCRVQGRSVFAVRGQKVD